MTLAGEQVHTQAPHRPLMTSKSRFTPVVATAIGFFPLAGDRQFGSFRMSMKCKLFCTLLVPYLSQNEFHRDVVVSGVLSLLYLLVIDHTEKVEHSRSLPSLSWCRPLVGRA